MSQALVPTMEIPVIAQETVHLVARNPVEMQNAQANLKAWLTGKIGSVETDIADFKAAIEHAKQSKWGMAPLLKAKNKIVGERVFYQKLLDAVEAGYTIIPEFPIDVFAIRVTREMPTQKPQSTTYSSSPDRLLSNENPDIVPTGEGEYKSPSQLVERWSDTETEGDKTVTRKWIAPTGFNDVIFPLRAARIEVMDATSEAMALKVFDRIGICPATKKADPLIIGQVLGRKSGYSQKCVNFLIAWHLNLNDL